MPQHIVYGNGAPASAPEMKGQHYIDEVNNVQYLSKNTSNVSDWELVGGSSVSLTNIEKFLEWKDSENNAYYSEFTYGGGGELTNKDVYTDATKTTKIYALVYSYNMSGDLSSIVLTKISDSTTLTRTFAYTGGGDLLSVTYS